MDQERWCHFLISVCYKAIIVNLVVLFLVWYFYSYNKSAMSPVVYWTKYLIVPSAIMAAITLLADLFVRSSRFSLISKQYAALFLILFFCTFLCFVHGIVAVLLASFIVPVLVSTIFTNAKLTRIVYGSALILLVASSLKMHFFSERAFGEWIGIETLTAIGLLVSSHFLAKAFILNGQDNITFMSNIYHDKMSLEEQLRLDPLTGLYNRKAYDEDLPRLMEECRLANAPLSIAVLDLDDFKQVNDAYGHAAGDRVLLRLADVLKRNATGGIHAFRIGGEEFVLLFKDYSIGDAVKVCEGIFSIMRSSSLPEVEHTKITFSCGVAGMSESLADPCGLFNAADATLYATKSSGKNKIMVHDLQA